MKCEKCSTEITEDETYHYAGKILCEDCYLDYMAVPKTCDPWAVHSAKRTSEQHVILTPMQDRILHVIRTQGPLTAQEICRILEIDADEFQRNFSTLRHMELARGFKQGDQVCYTVFSQ